MKDAAYGLLNFENIFVQELRQITPILRSGTWFKFQIATLRH